MLGEVPVTVKVYVPAGVPGDWFIPPEPFPPPHEAQATTDSRASARMIADLRLRSSKPRTPSPKADNHTTLWPAGPKGGRWRENNPGGPALRLIVNTSRLTATGTVIGVAES